VKDQATLLRAFALFQQSNPTAMLHIVGQGPLRSDLEQSAVELNLRERVCFRGEVDHASLPSVYRAASAFVLSSRHEAQGMVALEAAACGAPTVGTRVGVVPELTSSVAPIGAADALAGALAAALNGTGNPSEASERARTEFELQHCTDRFRSIYANLVSAAWAAGFPDPDDGPSARTSNKWRVGERARIRSGGFRPVAC
jgi:glycosyltransferase involved in cell wall biosynthesis